MTDKLTASGGQTLTGRKSGRKEGQARGESFSTARKSGTVRQSCESNGVVSDLGRELRKISDAFVASGGKLLNRRELDREVAERRGSR